MSLFSIGRFHASRKTLGLGLGLALLSAASGCQNALHEEKQALVKQNREQQLMIDELRAAKSQEAPITPPEAPKLVQPEVVTPAPAPTPTPTPKPKPAPAATVTDLGGDVTIDDFAGTTTVNFLGDTLFDSGQATLKSTAKTSLDKMVAGLKKQYAGKTVKVQGHSDSDPIRVSKWKSNQELSEARAKAVKEYLVQKGVDVSRISFEGLGSAKPKSTTDKAANRRVEIVVLTRD